MTKTKKLYGLILAGGFSKRMGQDKALLNYQGIPHIEFVHALLDSCCEQVFLSKRQDQSSYKNYQSIDDAPEFSSIGPLGGILSAMKAYPGISWLVLACDLPFVNSDTLSYLMTHRQEQCLATAFQSSTEPFPEPLCAIWEGHGYSHILDFLKKDIRCPRKVLINSKITLLAQENPRWLDNINTPEEFESARQAHDKR